MASSNAIASDSRFRDDLEALTRHPHRLAGSDENKAAVEYVTRRLSEIGVEAVLPLDTPVWTPLFGPHEVTLEVDGRRIALQPMRANVVAPPVTPEEGLRGPLRFLGSGDDDAFAATDLRGAIAILDYTAPANAWHRAFERGAAAVVFRGLPGDTAAGVKHASVPANLPRFYVGVDPATGLTEGVDLTRDRDEAVLRAAMRWRQSEARSVVAVLPGTGGASVDPGDWVVLAAPLDTLGSVPTRSPGARAAGNAALLLHAAARWTEDRPARSVAFVFINAQAHGLEGARWFYDAMHMPEAQHRALTEQHVEEHHRLEALRVELARWSSEADAPLSDGLRSRLRRGAEEAASDESRRAREERLETTKPGAIVGEIETKSTSDPRRWDALRRWLHQPDEAAPMSTMMHRETLLDLSGRVEHFLQRRADELERAIRRGQQRAELRRVFRATEAAGLPHLKLHVDFEFSGEMPTWGVYVGNDGEERTRARTAPSSGDAPGYYGPLLAHFRTTMPPASLLGPSPALFDARTLRDPQAGRRVTPTWVPTAGTVAGHYGHHHFALVTTHDARPREGHPADTIDNLDIDTLLAQGDAALELLRDAIDAPGLPDRPAFRAFAQSRYPAWRPGGVEGPVAQWRVAGGLSEDRPAAGAMVAVWPAQPGGAGSGAAWELHAQAAVPYFEPARRLAVDANGRFALVGMHPHLDAHFTTLGARFDDRGAVTGITNRQTLIQAWSGAARTDLIPATGAAYVFRPHELGDPGALRVMLPGRDAATRDNESLTGQVVPTAFAFLPFPHDPRSARLFEPAGPVRLTIGPRSASESADTGLLQHSARDLWGLNDERLRQLRDRAIVRGDLEGLQRRAAGALDTESPDGNGVPRVGEASVVFDAEAVRPGDEEADRPRTAYALSRRVYAPLRSTMNDLIVGVVVLLGLTIPFSFAVERLVIGAAGVHGRVAGFAAVFAVTFTVLYFTHPGFAIASTPVLIFLAFAILLLSSLVIVLLLRKFRVELAAIHGQGVGAHRQSSSQAATLLAATHIGISAMRRRRIRTALTIATVAVLTFTVLCFAGFEPRLGIRRAALGPTPSGAPEQAVLLRSLQYRALPPALRDLAVETAPRAAVEATWWAAERELPLARADDGQDTQLRAALGVTAGAVQRWPALARALGAATAEQHAAAIADDGVYLPPRTARRLGLELGDTVRVGGFSATVAGTFDPDALTRLRHLDARPVLPVDFLDAASTGSSAAGGSDAALESEQAVQEFQYLGATQVMVVGENLARRLNGNVYTLTVFAEPEEDLAPLVTQLARVSPTPVWSAGNAGLERRLLAVRAGLDAGPTLLVPLVLGGLIVFGTLLGSITDRREEIATFSALGLGPGHVGALFLAEAVVYAVVGGMGGQLLAQGAAASASFLAERGVGRPLPINYASGNALLAIAAVSATVLLSALYPAWSAARSANPGVAAAWRPPPPDGDRLDARLPFTLSAYDMTGVMAFLAEHLGAHADAGLGRFATRHVALRPDPDGRPELHAHVALAPFDLGVTQSFTLRPAPTDLPGVDEVAVDARRNSGTPNDWARTNRVFLRDLRRQFLLWRTLNADVMQRYRRKALEAMSNPANKNLLPE